MLYTALYTYSWSPLYIAFFVDVAVDRLAVPVTHAIETSVPIDCIKSCKFLTWFSNDLNFISGKRITVTSVLR
jgi:hypothetical protein